MGHYSTVEINLQIRPGKRLPLATRVRELLGRNKASNWVGNLVGLHTDKDGWLKYDDCYGRHQDTAHFACFLRGFVEAGDLCYVDDDGERWGYSFDGKGKVFLLEFVARRGPELTCKNVERWLP